MFRRGRSRPNPVIQMTTIRYLTICPVLTRPHCVRFRRPPNAPSTSRASGEIGTNGQTEKGFPVRRSKPSSIQRSVEELRPTTTRLIPELRPGAQPIGASNMEPPLNTAGECIRADRIGDAIGPSKGHRDPSIAPLSCGPIRSAARAERAGAMRRETHSSKRRPDRQTSRHPL